MSFCPSTWVDLSVFTAVSGVSQAVTLVSLGGLLGNLYHSSVVGTILALSLKAGSMWLETAGLSSDSFPDVGDLYSPAPILLGKATPEF